MRSLPFRNASPPPPPLPSPAARRSGERSAAGGGKGCAPLSWPVPVLRGWGCCGTARGHLCGLPRGRAREGAAGAAIGNRCDNGPNPVRASLRQDCDAVSLPLVWLYLPPCCHHPFSSSSQLSLWLCMNLHQCMHTRNTRTPQYRFVHSKNKQVQFFSEERWRKCFDFCAHGMASAQLVL